MADNDGFLSRWSRRKVQVQQGLPVPPAPVVEVPAPTAPVDAESHTLPALDTAMAPAETAQADEAPPAPTLEEALQLTPADDFSRFVGRGVDPQVKNAALKNLFSDPHFNVMDGLDTYIDDYNTPDPLPEGMLRKMVQSTMLGLFDDEPDPPKPPDAPADAAPLPAAAAPNTELPPPHEDPVVRLQPNDDAGPAGDQPGPVEDPGRQQ